MARSMQCIPSEGRPHTRRYARMRVTLPAIACLLLVACNRESATDAARPLIAFGRTGIGPLEFNYPRAAAMSPDGTLLIVDKAARIQRFSARGEFLSAWRMPAFDAGKPTGLGVGPDGRVFAADTHYSRVTVFTVDGAIERQFGENGTGPGQFMLPTDVEIDPDGEIYVSEYGGNDRISRYSPDWRFRFSFGGRDAGDARLERPQCIRRGADGTLWVADACHHRICRFSPDGRLLSTFGSLGGGAGELRFPYNVDVLSDGTLIVCEYGNNRIQRFNPAGKSLAIWGQAGRRLGELAYPWAAVVGADDRLYVVDSGNNRVQVVAAQAVSNRP